MSNLPGTRAETPGGPIGRRLLVVLCVLITALPPANAQERSVAVRIKHLDPTAVAGRQVVVLIAVNQYEHWRPLQQPVKLQ